MRAPLCVCESITVCVFTCCIRPRASLQIIYCLPSSCCPSFVSSFSFATPALQGGKKCEKTVWLSHVMTQITVTLRYYAWHQQAQRLCPIWNCDSLFINCLQVIKQFLTASGVTAVAAGMQSFVFLFHRHFSKSKSLPLAKLGLHQSPSILFIL